MYDKSPESATEGDGIVPTVRKAVGRRALVVLLAGLVAGYSVSVLGTDVVVLPIVGSVPGRLLGGIGLLASLATYRRFGCCGGSGECGCSGDCGDRCSYDA